mgnify:CR=1 FL=1
MSRPFSQATAEQVIRVSEAAVALKAAADSGTISLYTDLPSDLTDRALALAVDLGLVAENAGVFLPASPLCKLLRTPQEKERAAVLRVTIESFEPFQVFREELEATADASTAATRTKARLDLDCHREGRYRRHQLRGRLGETLAELFVRAMRSPCRLRHERDAERTRGAPWRGV